MTDIIIAEAVRSAVGRAKKGSLVNRRPDELMGEVVRGLLKRVPQVKPDMVGDIIIGCAMPEGEQGLNIARIAGVLADLPIEMSAMTINRFCSSGLQAIASAAGAICFGQEEIVIAGGVESMSMVPMGGFHLTYSPELMEKCPTAATPMGITAENVAQKFDISREKQDAFAVKCQQKAAAAVKAGKFKDEIVPVTGLKFKDGERVPFVFDEEELPRGDTTEEGLAKLKPSFAVKGTATPGNSSPLSDGAAAAMVMTKEKADELGIKPLGYFRSFVSVGVDPAIMGIGPIPAIRKLLEKNKLKIEDIDLYEINEAFAAQATYVQDELGIPDDKLNVNGGAIALGHPLGCTGAKLTATALHELKRRGGKYALVTMCIGTGMGAAGIFEAI